MRVLTPTENKRFNEMIGFVGLSMAVLLALSLLSYSPHDPSFNVSAPAPMLTPARNWIGPVGAHVADLFFQVLRLRGVSVSDGNVLCWRCGGSAAKRFDSPVAKIVGLRDADRYRFPLS